MTNDIPHAHKYTSVIFEASILNEEGTAFEVHRGKLAAGHTFENLIRAISEVTFPREFTPGMEDPSNRRILMCLEVYEVLGVE